MNRPLCVLFVLAAFQTACAQAPTGDTLLMNIERTFQSVDDYTVTLDIVTDIERTKIPPMKATMYFKQPERVHFVSTGFALLPREGMGTQFGRLTKRYTVDSVTREMKEGIPVYRLLLLPRDPRAMAYRARMWVHGTRWTPERVEVPLPDGRAMTALFTYVEIEGHWLPSNLVISFVMGMQDSTAATQGGQMDRPGMAAQRSGGRTGSVTIRYSGYRINTGLPDSLFTSSAAPPPR
jgi:outer membrane lipoprotein-sorting protein